MRYSIIALAVAAGLTASPAFAVNLIANGDFTSLSNGVGQITNGAGVTSATGWSTTGYNFVLSDGGVGGNSVYGPFSLWDAANGGSNTWNGLAPVGNFAALDGDYSVGSLDQTVSGLTVGQKYALTFDYAFAQQYLYNGPTIQRLTVSVGSTSLTTPDYDLPNHGFSGWSNGELDFTATSSSEVLSFLAYGNVPVPPFALVSDVALSAVPEPSTWALLLCGFAGLAFAGRRSARRKAAVAA